MEFKEVIKARYSCKKYGDRKVEADKLAAILEAGRLAPTAKNLQEQHVYVLQSAEALAKFDAVTPCRFLLIPEEREIPVLRMRRS